MIIEALRHDILKKKKEENSLTNETLKIYLFVLLFHSVITLYF